MIPDTRVIDVRTIPDSAVAWLRALAVRNISDEAQFSGRGCTSGAMRMRTKERLSRRTEQGGIFVPCRRSASGAIRTWDRR